MTDNRPKTVPFCKNCSHYYCRGGEEMTFPTRSKDELQEYDRMHLCAKEPPTIDIVTGTEMLPLCKDMRADPDKCGWEAKWFEAK